MLRTKLLPLAVTLASLTSTATRAQSPATTHGLHTEALAAKVEIVDGVATTTLRQTVVNASGAPLGEAIWILPLPEGAAADEFRMTVDGAVIESEVLAADRARGVYEDIVRRRRDPGLLEYMGRGCLRARIFPVPRGKAVSVEVTFRSVLPRTAGLARWSFPVRSAGVDGAPPRAVTLDLTIRSRRPIRNAFSPIRSLEILQPDQYTVRASFEGTGATLPDEELAVLYGLSNQDFGLNLLSSREGAGEEGTFLMLISPKRDWGETALKKSITFVLDTSGSMAGKKMDQARASLRFFLSSLREGDRFNVIPFSTEPRPFFDEPVAATKANVEAALAKCERIEALGGTNLSEALHLAVRTAPEPELVPLTVLLTDGLPTVGTVDAKTILAATEASNVGGARVFALGVGNDVNTFLLDSLAASTGGTRDYIRPEEDIELKTSALFAKLSHPVLSDLELKVEGVELLRVVPAKLPDLFEGEQLEVYGRYAGAGPHAITLSGNAQGTRRAYVFEGTFANQPVEELDFLASLWAHRRVGVLLDAIRLNGMHQELLDEVVHLGREYQIVTPYTSHLIVEEGLNVARSTDGFRGPSDGAPPRRAGAPTRNAPTSSGPTSPGGAGTGSDGFFLGRGSIAKAENRAPALDVLVAQLRADGIVAEDADDAEVLEVAREVLDQATEAAEALRGLGYSGDVGAGAVSESLYLRRLKDGDAPTVASLVSRFARRVGAKVFVMRAGVWTDRELTGESEPPSQTVVVECYSSEYFRLLETFPELKHYLPLGERVAVLLRGTRIEVTAPTGPSK